MFAFKGVYMNENNVFFDIYRWNNAWGYTYKGHFILLDGTVLQYDLPKEAGFEPSLSYKLQYTTKVKTLSSEILNTLHSLFDPMKESCIENPKVVIYDAGYRHYYGYHSIDNPVHLREEIGRKCNYDNDVLKKQVDRLIALIDTCIKSSEEVTCNNCGAKGAKSLEINEDEEIQVYCDEECQEKKNRSIRRNVRRVRMMRPENGRKEPHSSSYQERLIAFLNEPPKKPSRQYFPLNEYDIDSDVDESQ